MAKQNNNSTAACALGGIASLSTGVAGTYMLSLIGFACPLATCVIAPMYGRLVADAVSAFVPNRLDILRKLIAIGSILAATVIVFVAPTCLKTFLPPALSQQTQSLMGLSIGLAIAVCFHSLQRKPLQTSSD